MPLEWTAMCTVSYVQLGIWTLEDAKENFTLDHNCSFFILGWFSTELCSPLWIYWRFSVSIFTSTVTGPRKIYRIRAQVNHTGPVLPHCSHWTRLELTAAWPRLRARQPQSTATITQRAGNSVNPLGLARPVSVNALNTQGDSNAAPSGSAWSKGRRRVISRCDWSGAVKFRLESRLALFAGWSPRPETQPYSDLHRLPARLFQKYRKYCIRWLFSDLRLC